MGSVQDYIHTIMEHGLHPHNHGMWTTSTQSWNVEADVSQKDAQEIAPRFHRSQKLIVSLLQ